MKILLLSDSHRCLTHMTQAAEREQPDLILHMGDHLADGQKLQMAFRHIPLYTVPGNCDMVGWDTPLTAVHTFSGVQVLCTHGHEFGVKRGLAELSQAARRRGVQVAIFGHTHQAYCQEKDGILLINPGTCGAGASWSYGVLTVTDGVATCQLMEMED